MSLQVRYIKPGRVLSYSAPPLQPSIITSPPLLSNHFNMKTTAVATVALAALSQVAQAHYIFQQLTANGAKGALCTL